MLIKTIDSGETNDFKEEETHNRHKSLNNTWSNVSNGVIVIQANITFSSHADEYYRHFC